MKSFDEIVLGMLSSPCGRLFVAKVLTTCGIYDNRHDVSEIESAYYRGRRSIGIDIRNYLEAVSPGSYYSVIKELDDSLRNIENKPKDRRNGND